MEYVLCHAGVKGMKWGVRRYQNKDGSLTPAGKKRYGGTTSTKKSSIKDRTVKKIKKQVSKENLAKTVAKGAEVAAKLATASVVDDVFYNGMGKKVAKETVKQTGRAAVTAYMMARGGYNIRWYDN